MSDSVQRDPPHDPDHERIYLAVRLSEARQVEQALAERGMDYVVEIEKFEMNMFGIIPREYDGAAFYVPAAIAESCRRVLYEAGLRSGLVDEEGDYG
jgi:hypothetical protein